MVELNQLEATIYKKLVVEAARVYHGHGTGEFNLENVQLNGGTLNMRGIAQCLYQNGIYLRQDNATPGQVPSFRVEVSETFDPLSISGGQGWDFAGSLFQRKP